MSNVTFVAEWMNTVRITFHQKKKSNESTRLGASLPKDGNKAGFREVVF